MKAKTLIVSLLCSIFVFSYGCSASSKPTSSKPQSSVTTSDSATSDSSSNGEESSASSSSESSVESPTESDSSFDSSISGEGEKGSSSSGTSTDTPVETFYKVNFDADGGTGTVTVADKKENETFNLPANGFNKQYYTFIGWGYNGSIYAVGDIFSMPASDVTFTAIWKSDYPGTPAFSESSYYYDRLGGGKLELPFDLEGTKIYYVYVDGVSLDDNVWSYNDDNACLEINEYTMIRLADGVHTVKTVTDAGDAIPASCKVTTDNSVVTAFNSSKTLQFKYGKGEGVKVNFNFNGTTVKELYQGDKIISSDYYSVSGNNLIISSDWLKRYYKTTEYEVVLSNNDVYSFSVATNVIFYTDYDVTTIHDTTNSNIGHNPLYQYYSAVSIVDAPVSYGFESGKCLKIKPNTVDVTYDCNGYFTLRSPSCSYMWYNAGFDSAKTYRISFDYATENTTTGEFLYRNVSGSWGQNLLIGSSNDNVKHHFEAIVSGETIGDGVYLRAFFKGGSAGSVYMDNFLISEVETSQTVNVVTKNAEVVYGYSDLTITGDFNGVEIISIKRQGSNYWDNTVDNDNGSDNFAVMNGYMSLSHIKEFTASKIVFDKSFVDQLYGTQSFILTFSNGQTGTFSVTSNTMFYTNYDETYINEETDGNVRSCQDTAMRSIVDYNGGKAIKYTPGKAVQDHANKWANGDNNDCKIMTFSNNAVNHWWWEFDFIASSIIFVTFDYETTSGDFVFQYWDASGGRNSVALSSGKGSFYKEIPSDTQGFAIGYAGTTKPAESVYMIIDNYGFGTCESSIKIEKATIETTFGQKELTVNGQFGGVTVTAIKRQGTNFWDNTVDTDNGMDNYAETNGYMSTSHIKSYTDTKIVFDESFVSQIYDTETITLTFSNGEKSTFKVKSNTLFYTNYDETYVFEESEGNVASCQDTAMRSLVDYNGGKALKYTPSKAVQSYAVKWSNGAGNDNKIMTFSNVRLKDYWWQFDFGTDGTLFVRFDYETTGTGFTFQYWDVNGQQKVVNLENGKGTFYRELDVSDLSLFAIGYAGTTKPADSVYMIIDNYGFGIKA